MEKVSTAKAMKRMGLLMMACFIGAPLLTGPVLGEVSYRPLNIGGSIKVSKAFGPDDEDCVYEIRRVPRPTGLTHPRKRLVCND